MKILITQNTDWLKRNPAQQHHLAEMLSLRGHEIRAIDFELLWSTQEEKELFSKKKVFHNVSKIYDNANVTVIRPGIIKAPLLDYFSLGISYQRALKQQIKEFNPDIIVGFSIFAYLSGKVAKANNIPFVYYWIDVSHRLIPFKFLQPIGWMIERQTLKMADRVLTINDKLRDYVVQLGANPERTQVLGAGINLDKLNPNKYDGSTIRKQYGFSQDDIVLFFMGWLYHFSGLKEVATELSKIKDENPKIKLLIVGDGDAFDDLQRIRKNYHFENQIILTGKQPYESIPAFIASSDICLLPAYNNDIMQDIVPIKMYEYMAMKKPVIATRLPGVMKEFGEDNGVVYVDRPEDALWKAIELIENDSIEKEGMKARKFVEGNSWDKITDEFEKILEEVINTKGE